MSARAWTARKPGPFHLTGRQRRTLARDPQARRDWRAEQRAIGIR